MPMHPRAIGKTSGPEAPSLRRWMAGAVVMAVFLMQHRRLEWVLEQGRRSKTLTSGQPTTLCSVANVFLNLFAALGRHTTRRAGVAPRALPRMAKSLRAR